MGNFLKGFIYAFKGLVVFFRHERNGRVQLAIAFATVLLALALNVSPFEWIVLLLCIAVVLSFEMINSAVEKLCNFVHPDYHLAIKIIKDISAGAVLWVSICCGVIGFIVFVPKILHFFTT